MGVYKAAVVTESGQNLIAQAFTSEKKLIFTSAKTSSYSYPAGTNISALTGLQDVVQSVIPSGTKTIGGNVAQVTVRFDNDSIDQAYLIQTIGLYAKIEDGEETLFSVTQAMVPDEMPVHSEVSPSAYIYNIQSTVQNASQITITVNPTGAASVQDFLDIQNPTFDDSGTSEEISSFPEFLDTVKSKMNFFQFFRNLKSGLQFVLHVGSIVNNCVTDNPNLPLSAAQGKALQDQLATLNSNSDDIKNLVLKKMLASNGVDHIEMSVWKILFSMDIIQDNHLRFPDKKYLCEDIIFDFDYYPLAKKVAMSDDTGYCYCLNGESLSQMYQKDKFDRITFQVSEMRTLAKEIGFDEEAFLRIENFYIAHISWWLFRFC